MTGGLGLGVLGATHVRHACDGTRRGARGWCKSRGLEVVRRNVRCEGKSRGRQGGEPEARGRTVTIQNIRGDGKLNDHIGLASLMVMTLLPLVFWTHKRSFKQSI